MERFRHENCRACFCLQRVGRKTGSLVRAHGSVVFVHYFQRKLTTAEFSGLAFASLKQAAANTLPTVLGQDNAIVDVDKRFGSEGRKTDEAHCRPHWDAHRQMPGKSVSSHVSSVRGPVAREHPDQVVWRYPSRPLNTRRPSPAQLPGARTTSDLSRRSESGSAHCFVTVGLLLAWPYRQRTNRYCPCLHRRSLCRTPLPRGLGQIFQGVCCSSRYFKQCVYGLLIPVCHHN